MRVIECDFCGELLAAGNDEDLVSVTADHMSQQHADAQVGEEQARGMVERDAYEASDS
jgi:hypothetical protein